MSADLLNGFPQGPREDQWTMTKYTKPETWFPVTNHPGLYIMVLDRSAVLAEAYAGPRFYLFSDNFLARSG